MHAGHFEEIRLGLELYNICKVLDWMIGTKEAVDQSDTLYIGFQ